ncbi:NUDIX domain-containing protein [Cohnella faecalis]|uniref:NUDIX domain-containing protein n=1 Tax=Cohnella faecalis TaxID=2315694 RepID=A0A398CRL3_9BACL|nr:NUDIX domain-containing protein [Cohnella faecalis]RIE03418.1 NUDIX domain-containing protein [Cohnella faecalis]
MMPIRNSAKAIIIHNESLLLTKNKDDQGYFYLFPGGGQEKGEELKHAVKRECMEEAGCEVEVEDLLFIREYIGKNHEFAEWDKEVHQVEFYFRCILENKDTPASIGENPDENQVGVEWVELSRLDEIRLYPNALGEKIKRGNYSPCYLGDSN